MDFEIFLHVAYFFNELLIFKDQFFRLFGLEL